MAKFVQPIFADSLCVVSDDDNKPEKRKDLVPCPKCNEGRRKRYRWSPVRGRVIEVVCPVCGDKGFL